MRITKKVLEEMLYWLQECFNVEELAEATVVRLISKHYEGGVNQFLLDYDTTITV